MTKFNPENKETLTYGETLLPAMEITDQADADQYKEAYISFMETVLQKEAKEKNLPPLSAAACRLTAQGIVDKNIGYFAGYYDKDTYMRVTRLFKTTHPVFGTEYPLTEGAFNASNKIDFHHRP